MKYVERACALVFAFLPRYGITFERVDERYNDLKESPLPILSSRFVACGILQILVRGAENATRSESERWDPFLLMDSWRYSSGWSADAFTRIMLTGHYKAWKPILLRRPDFVDLPAYSDTASVRKRHFVLRSCHRVVDGYQSSVTCYVKNIAWNSQQLVLRDGTFYFRIEE